MKNLHIWHGWPPQVWDGDRWVYIDPARLLCARELELCELRDEVERLLREVVRLRWLCQLRSGADGG